MKYYPGEHSHLPRSRQIYVSTGEFRAPKKGEYYLSGAIPCAYLAPNDFTQPYHIMRAVPERRKADRRKS